MYKIDRAGKIELVIAFCCVVAVWIIIGLLTYLGFIVSYAEHSKAELIQKCNDMNLGDNSSSGYRIILQQDCMSLNR